MIDALRNLPAGQLALVVCAFFVGLTWVGAIFIRPILRLFVRSNPDLNALLGNFVSIYGVFYGILMGLLAVAAYQNKVEVEQAISSEVTSAFALFRNVSAYPEAVRRPLQEAVRNYVQFAIDGEWPAMRRGEIAHGAGPLIDAMQQRITAFEPTTAGQGILHAETTRQFYSFLERRAVRLLSATAGIPGFMWYVVVLGALISIFLVWLFDMSLLAELFLGGLMSFFIGSMISLILILDQPLRGGFGIGPDMFRVLLEFMNKVLGQPAG